MSSTESLAVIGECLVERGWDVRITTEYLHYGGPQEQQSAYQEEFNRCYADLGFADVQPPAYTKEFLQNKYAQESATRECLVALGETLPAMPSFQAYSDLFFGEGLIYSNYDQLGRGPHTELKQECGDPLDTWTSEG